MNCDLISVVVGLVALIKQVELKQMQSLQRDRHRWLDTVR